MKYGSDQQPGIRRLGTTRVRYIDEHTGRVPGRSHLERIRRLAIPPAWTDVWISRDADSHVQATGRDSRGRKQYRYHPTFVARRSQHKFGELESFGAALPGLRRQVDRDLGAATPEHDHVVAIVVRLLDITSLRVGNDEYANSNGSYGLTTLHNRHVTVHGRTIRLKFKGKSSHDFDISIDEPKLAKLVRRCQDLPGQRLFEYRDDAGVIRSVTSDSVNDYLRRHTDLTATAKSFRTWNASVAAAERLAVVASNEESPDVRTLNAVVDDVASLIGNTRAVCRNSYLHPVVVDRYMAGSLPGAWDAPITRRVRGLTSSEARFLRLIRSPARTRSSLVSA